MRQISIVMQRYHLEFLENKYLYLLGGSGLLPPILCDRIALLYGETGVNPVRARRREV